MIKRQIFFFILRWLVAGVGMWICISLFGQVEAAPSVWTYVLAGLIFALVDSVVKPFVAILALPFAVLTMGLWSILLSVAMLWLTIQILPGVSMDLLGAVLSAFVMSVINGLAGVILPFYERK